MAGDKLAKNIQVGDLLYLSMFNPRAEVTRVEVGRMRTRIWIGPTECVYSNYDLLVTMDPEMIDHCEVCGAQRGERCDAGRHG